MAGRVFMLPVWHPLSHPASLRIEDIRKNRMDLLADHDEVSVRTRLPVGGDKVLNSSDKPYLPDPLSKDRIDVKDVNGSQRLFRRA